MDNFDLIKDKIRRSARQYSHPEAKLIAVSKTQPAEKVIQLIERGHRLFGESKVQEAIKKFTPLKERYPDIELHCIGQLQTKKARDAVRFFDAIHSIDRPKLALAIAGEFEKQARRVPCFIQVNIGDEPQKGGVVLEQADSFIRYCIEALGLPVVGLMCIPPVEGSPLSYFARLADLAKCFNLRELSMGMSSDYEAALRYGATYVRIGTAIFGERVYA
jgi:pyridoxal phosphate enzyme (YggS family)